MLELNIPSILYIPTFYKNTRSLHRLSIYNINAPTLPQHSFATWLTVNIIILFAAAAMQITDF